MNFQNVSLTKRRHKHFPRVLGEDTSSKFLCGAELLISVSLFYRLQYVFKVAKRLLKGRGEKVKVVCDPRICFVCSLKSTVLQCS